MAQVNVTITLRDADDNIVPLQRNFVEHIAFGVPIGLYITDDQGRIRDKDGNLGISNLTNDLDIRVLLQNAVAKHQDLLSWKDWHVSDGDTKRLTVNATAHINKFRALNHCVKVYDTVFRQFEVFSANSRGDFPLGSGGTLDNKKNRSERIELDFPTGFPFAQLSFPEPKSVFTGFPILHIKDDDGRLFGTNRQRRTLIASELAHALHFSFLTSANREDIQNRYLGWLVGQVVMGDNATHDLGIETIPLVAFLESLDHFSSRFFRFFLDHPNDAIDTTFRNNFILSELSSGTFCNFTGDLHTGTVTRPKFTGTSVEGAVYSAIFLDFARRPGVGLKTAVNAFFRSKALTFGEYKSWIINNKPDLKSAINAVSRTWGL